MPAAGLIGKWRQIGATLGGPPATCGLVTCALVQLENMATAAGVNLPAIDTDEPASRLAVRLRQVAEELQAKHGPETALAFVADWKARVAGG